MAKKSLTIEALERDADAAWAAFFAAICSSDSTVGDIRHLMKTWERMDKRVKLCKRLIPPTYAPPKGRGKNRNENVHTTV